LKAKTSSIKEKQLETLRKLSKEIGVPQSLLIRRAVKEYDNEKAASLA